MPVVNNFCCLCSLQTGCIIIGLFEIIEALISTLLYYDSKYKYFNDDNVAQQLVEFGFKLNEDYGVVFYILMILQYLKIIFSILMIYGAIMLTSCVLIPWILSTFSYICVMMYFMISQVVQSGPSSIYPWWIIHTVLSVYFMATAFSLYFILRCGGICAHFSSPPPPE